MVIVVIDERYAGVYQVLCFVDFSKPVPVKETIDYIQELTGEDRDFIKRVLENEVSEGRLQHCQRERGATNVPNQGDSRRIPPAS